MIKITPDERIPMVLWIGTEEEMWSIQGRYAGTFRYFLNKHTEELWEADALTNILTANWTICDPKHSNGIWRKEISLLVEKGKQAMKTRNLLKDICD